MRLAELAQDHSGNRNLHRYVFDAASEHAQRLGRIAGWLELWNSPERGPCGIAARRRGG